jgi:hypothetical protein
MRVSEGSLVPALALITYHSTSITPHFSLLTSHPRGHNHPNAPPISSPYSSESNTTYP